ncbi:hypothetical protein J2848_006015 [Azospirillum lipoferum]|uniref:Baseplate protein J-like domain-containing protein n=1 Tax=Azospirillum lipoferum TaxID=193 RepID=A0A5A9GEF1_AZOLI|nr:MULTISPECIES: hypothetical protein [Azospirillum]KAA0592740.1 hypothetical protein FZ942_26705 [Azospirillum lipoferum]MCP1614312.1 hypothetical protein [Azospirillum lipoferum]MDW5531907.1 hypothetical protein [Azospirillum sp. NL1]
MSAPHPDLLVLNAVATSQRDRLRSAPAPERVQADGRSLAQLLSFAVDYGRLITFYDLTNLPDGDWSAFFSGDPSIALALQVGLDIRGFEADFDRLADALRDAPSLEAQRRAADALVLAVLRLVRLIETDADSSSIESTLGAAIASRHRGQLAAPAQQLIAHLGGNPLEHGLRRAWTGIERGWADRLADLLGDLAEALLGVLEQGRAAACTRLEASLEAQGHQPQAALYNAFTMLFRHAQDTVNRFPERLVRFYDVDVLHQDRRDGSADRVYLAFTPAKGVIQASAPKGTVFTAGSDASGQPVQYTLDQAVSVGTAAVAALRTLTVTRESPQSSAVPLPATPLPAQVLGGVAVLSQTPPLIAEPFPLFGAEEAGTDGALVSTAASLGFALASPTLELAGGQRTVSLGLSFAADGLAAAEALLAPLGGDPAALLAQVLAAAFALRYSTAGGWMPVAGYTVTAPATGQNAFTLAFALTADAAPFVALSSTPPVKTALPVSEGVVPDDTLPVLVADLLQTRVTIGAPAGPVDLYPYAVLNGLALTGLTIAVAVDGLTDLTLTTPGGRASADQPFTPFGSPPVQGAALDVAAPELFIKTLDRLSMRIGWYGLPVQTTGFYGYYSAYVIDADGVKHPPGSLFDNQSFRASFSVVNPGLWTIGQAAGTDPAQDGTADDPPYLFRTVKDASPADGETDNADADGGTTGDGAAGNTVPDSRGRLSPETVLAAPAIVQTAPPDYYDPASSALRLALAEPDYAFGNTLFSANTMAASVELTAAASACAQKCSRPGPALAAMLDPLLATIGQASDKSFVQSVGMALQQALSQMVGAGVAAAQDAISDSGAPPDQQSAWRDSLAAALNGQTQRPLSGRRSAATDPAAALTQLSQWIAANGTALGTGAQPDLGVARTLATSGGTLAATWTAAQGQPVPAARQTMTGAVQTAKADLDAAEADRSSGCLQRCLDGQPTNGFPNQPWLPQMAGLSVSYGAATALPDDRASVYFHLLPFDGVAAAGWPSDAASNAGVPLLAPMPQDGALFIGLSAQDGQLALLFSLAPGEEGWPEEAPPVSWSQAVGAEWAEWTPLTPLRDDTNGLHNSGIVTFELAAAPAALSDAAASAGATSATAPTVWLRAAVDADTDVFPLLADLVTNAGTASWIGPGGADSLGTPLKAGTITASAAKLPDIATVSQPLPSFGGRPVATGKGFEMWMAERLRHKGFGVQSWDYARLALAEFPALCQVAVVPAANGDGTPAPGTVWVVAVPGPATQGVSDPTEPTCDTATLGQIHDLLATRISPFIKLGVSNPPYQRMKVTARLVFSDQDTVEASIQRLNDELIRFLSPWPDPASGPRPDNYYTADAVARFIRHRPYVLGILSFDYAPDPSPAVPGWSYLTSALAHALTGEAP